ncbi:MAG TPA: sulfate adenylyltransferase subunit CysN [Terriglobales bacterium]|jgi:sulfate adenylyltransferase large subunit|nr:sulfate adenylyltransferase subunit CysN [Terriglobales bacterium]
MPTLPLQETDLTTLESFFQQELDKDLLRLVTAGSVDDGKSTLIGRLLYDSQSVYEDQLHAVHRASQTRNNGNLDLSLLTDGLRAEREQGITIDVAYRYFTTHKRKFILADTPGHVQYTRNMATGASNADLAIVLLDARRGIQEQSRRHAYIASLLGITHLVVAVNKMDQVSYKEDVFQQIQREFSEFLDQLSFHEIYWLPMSALEGDNVVERGQNMPWFDGRPLLEYLENVKVPSAKTRSPFRFAVQRVVRPHQDFRGYSGEISSGVIHVGSPVKVLPAGPVTIVKSIHTYEGEQNFAFAPMSVTLSLQDEIDISRGDLICSAEAPPLVSRSFVATVIWFDERPLQLSRKYLLKHMTQFTRAEVKALQHRVNIQSFSPEPCESLKMNEIGVAEIEASQEIFFDPYRENRYAGSAILIDPETNFTVGALIMLGASGKQQIAHPTQEKGKWAPLTADERVSRFGHRPAVLALAGREKLVQHLERRLFEQGAQVAILKRWNEDAAAVLREAGVIVLALDAAAKATVSLPPLPQEDEQAVDKVLDVLLAANVLLRI